MGSQLRAGLITRCCQGASFGFGFVLTVLTLVTMFWIAWCYFGLTIIQISDTQRRAIVTYTYPAAKPSPTPTSAPERSTTSAVEETSVNSISKSPTPSTLQRGSSRGDMPAKVEKKKEVEVSSSLAKGDYASRDRPAHSMPAADSRGSSASASSLPRGPPRPSAEQASGHKADILSGSSSEEVGDDRIYARRVMPPGAENRPEDTSKADDYPARRNLPESEPDSRLDISPTKVYDELKPGSSRRSPESEVDRKALDDGKTPLREYADRDRIPPSRRDDDRRPEADPGRRDDADRGYPRRDRPRYDDDYDRGRYDRRDRVKDYDDAYAKGDTRAYPDDKQRDRVRERRPDDAPRRTDEDRYRDYDDRPRSRDRDYPPRERIPEVRAPTRDDRYKDDDRYVRNRDGDRYVPRDDERYRSRDADRFKDDEGYKPRDDRYKDDDRYLPEDRIRDRKDDRYAAKDDERYRPRDDRYRARVEDRYRSRDEDEKYRTRDRDDEEKYRTRDRDDDEKYRTRDRDDGRYISASRTVDERERVRPREDDRYIESRDDKTGSRRGDVPASSRSHDYDVGGRDEARYTLRPSRPLPDDDRYTDRRDTRYTEERRILPTKAVDFIAKSSIMDARPKDVPDDDRYTERDNGRRDDRYTAADDRYTAKDDRYTAKDDRYTAKDDRYTANDDRYTANDDRYRNTRIQASRGSSVLTSASRRIPDERVDPYQTRLPGQGAERNENSREEVVLDRRSYASGEVDEYRRQSSRSDADDRSRRPAERPRYRDDEKDAKYEMREPDDDDDRSYDRPRSRDRYDDRPRDLPLPLRKYDDDSDRRRNPDVSTVRRDEGRTRSRSEERYYDSRQSSRTYDDDDDRRRPAPSRSREPGDVVTREKRFQDHQQSGRVSDRERAGMDTGAETRTREDLRPLSPKDVIEAAMKQSDTASQNPRNVFYPVFDPRVANLTSSEVIRPCERRGGYNHC